MRRPVMLLSCLVSIAIVVSGNLSAGAVPAQAVRSASSAVTAGKALTPPDPAFAAPGAGAQKKSASGGSRRPDITAHRVAELPGERSATAKRFRMSDGTVEAELYSAPVHYVDKAGKWQGIDTRIGPTDRAGFAFANTTNGFESRFGRQADRLVSVEAGGRSILLGTPDGGGPVEPVAQGDTVTYRDLFGTADVRYRVGPKALKEEIVLDAPPRQASYTFSLRTGGVQVEALPDGSIGFYRDGDRNGRPAFVMPKPFMTDSATDVSSPYGVRWSDKVTQSVSRRGTEVLVTIAADPAWLAAKERRYPVAIDPTIEIVPAPSAAQDTMIAEAAPNNNYGTSSALNVGNAASGANSYRSLLKFDLAQFGIPAGTKVKSASLDVHFSQPHTSETVDVPVEARKVTATWSETTATWANINASYFTGSLPFNYLQVDDEDESRVQLAGPWLYADAYPNSLNGGLHYLPIGTTPDTFTWSPNVSDAGNYRVDAYYTAYSNRGTPTYAVTGDTGSAQAAVNQTTGTSGTGYWATLATQHFAPGKAASVTMTRGSTSSSPVADAIRLVESGTQVKLTKQRDAWHSFAVGNVVQEWVNTPSTNFGLMLKATNESAGIGGPSYEASEAVFGETANRPRLLIQYDEPSVALAVPTKVNPNGAELSWGDYVDPSPEDEDDLLEFQIYRGCVTLADTTCANPAPVYFGASPPAGAELLATIPKDVHSYVDTTATASSATATATYRYWVIARTKDGTQSASSSQLVQMPRPGRVLRVLTGDIADTTIANATAYVNTNIPTPDTYSWTMPGNNHTTYGDTRALLDFDTSSIPAKVKVMDSELQLWKSTAPGSGATFDLHELNRDFVESQATWNRATSTIAWTAAGGDYSPTALASQTTAGSPVRLTWKTAAVTGAVQKWVDDAAANHGLLIKARDESASQQRLSIASGESVDLALRPRLLVEYLEKSTAGTYYAPEIPDRVAPNTTLSVPVTVTNTTGSPWSGHRLSYRWMIGSTDAADEGDRLYTTVRDLQPGESQTVDAQIRVPINSTSGSKRIEYRLELELRNAQNVWLSDPASGVGIAPLTQPVIVEDPLLTRELGLEKFFAYSGEDTGSGSVVTANLHTGDVVFSYDPIRNPSRGAATFVRLTHDAADLTSTAAGHGWSVQASTATRLGRTAMVFDTEKVPQTPYPRKVMVTDGDGTGHQYTFVQPDPDDPATWHYDRPAGVHLDLRYDPTAPIDRAWTLTRPDGTRFYFEDPGGNAGAIQRYIVDHNGNQTTFTYDAVYGDTPLLTSIKDPDDRTTLTLTYVPGTPRLQRVADISGRTLRFVYTIDGETLTELRDGGNYDPVTDTYGVPPKVFTFGYTAEGRLSSVKDPLNGETKFTYYTAPPWAGRVQTLTDRRGKVTEFAYADPGGTEDPAFETTVTGVSVEGGTTRRFATVYTTDAFGRPTTIKNAKNETTKLGWDRDNNVIRMEEANHAVTTWLYEPDSGYPTSIRDAEANKNGTPATTLSYTTMPGSTLPDSTMTAPVWVLTDKTSPQGRKWQFGYDARGNLKTVTDPLGVASPTVGDYQTSYDYDEFGQLTQVHDANGNAPTIYSSYDVNGYPRTITDPLGKATTFVYDDRGQVVKVTDARGKDTTAECDVFGRPTKQSVPLDALAARFQTTQTIYDLNDNVRKVIAPNGAETTATYDAADEQETSILPSNGATGERKVSYSYDDLGRLSQQAAPQGNLTPANPDDFVTRYSYDPIGQLTDMVTPFDSASSYKTTYEYDGVGNLQKVTDPRKNDTADPDDATKQMVYDLNHRPITVIDAAGYPNRTQYDRDGLVTAQIDADGNKKSITLDGRGKVSQVSMPHTPTGGTTVQRTTRYFYDENGNQTAVESPQGVSTPSEPNDSIGRMVYDANNRLIERDGMYKPGDGNYDTPARTFYEYDAVGNLSRQSEPTEQATKAGARGWSSFTWFDNGLARTSTDPWGIATTYDYNQLGLQTSRTLTSAAGGATRTMAWDFWPDGSQKARSDTAPLAGLDEVLVDNSDTQNTVVTGTWATSTAAATKVGPDYRTHAGASGSTDTFAWKLRVPSAGTYEVFARCPQGAGTATAAVYTVHHSAGSTAKTINQATCTAASPWLSLGSYTYAEGVDKKVTLAVPASGTVVADAIKMVRAGGSPGVVKDFGYGYNVNGQLTSITDNTTGALTDTYEIRYDGLQRADQVRELKSGTARSATTYTYDANSNLTSWFADHQVAPETDQYTAYSYDVRDMLETIKSGLSPSDPSVKTTSYTYTPRGQRASETKPNGNKVTYRYIEDGLLRSQIENRYVGTAATLVSSHSYAYNLDGHKSLDVSKVQNADSPGTYLSQTASLVYTPDNRLRWIAKSGANPGAFEGYQYDIAGNLIWQRRGTTDTSYLLDRDRVLCAAATKAAADACAAGSTSYNYDPFGRLNTITIAGTTDKTLERYGYDGFDRTVSHRKYDPATGAVKSSETKGFDPLDRTVQQTVQAGTSPAKTTTFTYLGLSEQVVSEQQPDAGGAAKTTASYTYGPSGERISQAKTPLTGGASETSYYGTNSHTDVETLTSETGNARSTYRYTGYGENDATGFTGKDKATATSGPEVEPYNPYRFNSKRWDPATGGYDMGFRDYSPGLNRFLTRDMYNGALADLHLGTDPWSTNRYAFAGGNPVTGIEYDGHCDVDPERSGCTSESTPAQQPTSYQQAQTEYIDEQPEGSTRVTIKVQPIGADRGIFVLRTYIPSKSAAFGYLEGDNRGSSSDPRAPYRIAVAWNTATRDVTFTVNGSRLAQHSFGGNPRCAAYSMLIKGSCNPPRNREPIKPARAAGPGKPNDIVLSQVGSSLRIESHGLNSLLPCCRTDHQIQINAATSEVWLWGDDYPTIEVYRYTADGAVQTLVDSAGSWAGGLAAIPWFPADREEHWLGGVKIS